MDDFIWNWWSRVALPLTPEQELQVVEDEVAAELSQSIGHSDQLMGLMLRDMENVRYGRLSKVTAIAVSELMDRRLVVWIDDPELDSKKKVPILTTRGAVTVSALYWMIEEYERERELADFDEESRARSQMHDRN